MGGQHVFAFGRAIARLPSCPDCDVGTDETGHKTSYRGDGIRVDAGGGPLGALDLEGEYLTCYACPECGLARFDADA